MVNILLKSKLKMMLLLYFLCLTFLSCVKCVYIEDTCKQCHCATINISKKIILPPSSPTSLAVNVRKMEIVIDNHLPRELCDQYYFVKKVINPYSHLPKMSSHQQDFKSGCLQCAACLTIAQQIDEAIKDLQIGVSDPLQEIQILNASLNYLCRTEFHKYELANHQGYSFVFENDKKSGIIQKTLKYLKERCLHYLNQMNVVRFYNNLLNENKVRDLLCRSDSVFRDCGNINYQEMPVTEDYKNKKIIFKIDCS